MTANELYKWAKENNAEDYEIICEYAVGNDMLDSDTYDVEANHEAEYIEIWLETDYACLNHLRQLRHNGFQNLRGITNGEVIKAMFPDAEVHGVTNDSELVFVVFPGHVSGIGQGFDKTFWNAPYKGASGS